MNKIIPKLVSAFMILLISMIMVVMSTYAWMTMSGTPEIGGINISIGGLDTILIAPDIKKEVDGVIVHYPGDFNDKINFSHAEGYEYLSEVVGLTPYSTADGLNWFSADYVDPDANTTENAGQLLPIEQFPVDSMLVNANLTELPADGSSPGGYVYLDFWVVSPMEECELRISQGDANGGSFVIDMKSVSCADNDGDGTPDDYFLTQGDVAVSASTRVGFLVNSDKITDRSMEEYTSAPEYSDKFRYLLGEYQDPGEQYNRDSTFMIYEPNGNIHSGFKSYVYTNKSITERVYNNGSYVKTMPIGLVDGVPTPVDIADKLCVQLENKWCSSENGVDIIDEMFYGYYCGASGKSLDKSSLYNGFYYDFLQNQYSQYVAGGEFIKSTDDLYRAMVNGVIEENNLGKLTTATATDTSVIATLYRNVPQKIRMYIWIEGQDVDCVNKASGNSFTVNLELAGSTVK